MAQQRSPSGQFVRAAVTAESIGKEYGVSERTVRRAAKLAAFLETRPDLLAGVMAGAVTSRAVRKLMREEEELEAALRQIVADPDRKEQLGQYLKSPEAQQSELTPPF
jgi:predicted transcriptional regulator